LVLKKQFIYHEQLYTSDKFLEESWYITTPIHAESICCYDKFPVATFTIVLNCLKSMDTSTDSDRRPLKVRGAGWAQGLARGLARSGVSPNQISVASVAFAAAGAACMLAEGWWLIGAAACIQGRLLCNLFDGMVAVEHDRATPLGIVYNEFPDRIADSILLAACGYAAALPSLGWMAALAAALTAYVRVFGASCGLGHDFRGPMAKQHRMALLTLACIATPLLPFGIRPLAFVLGLIAALSLLTCVTRTLHLCRQLEQGKPS
jgi:CDP-diacylglycerol--glycerol-3-phosphate 3-phosphatidyltransferase